MDQAIEYALWLPQVPYDRDRSETGTGTLSEPPWFEDKAHQPVVRGRVSHKNKEVCQIADLLVLVR